MEQVFATKLATEQKIDISQLVREEWEIKILNAIFDSGLGRQLIFKGGTALRLAYNSPRFSEDLDFSIKLTVKDDVFEKEMKEIESKYPEIVISDLKSKFYTYFCQFKVSESWLGRSFSIKIEISRRQGVEKSELKTLSSPTINIQVLAQVQTLDQIQLDKEKTARTRAKPRDFFDLWYIYGLKRLPEKLPASALPAVCIKAELRKFLPKNYWPAVDQIIKEVGR